MSGPIKLYNLDKNDLEIVVKSLKPDQAIFMKFTADWCGPCKTIKADCDKMVSICSSNIYYIEIDIEESIELYTFFKAKKLLKGIPALYLYFGECRQPDPKWYLPDYSVLSANKSEVNIFFAQLLNFIKVKQKQEQEQKQEQKQKQEQE
jgi:thiol:disulfide interchange protein